MMMSTKYFLGLVILTLLFVGCAEKNVTKDKTVEQLDKNTTQVINKSIQECATYNITLDRARTTEFMRRTPKKTIEKTIQSKEKTPKELCQFFEQETSIEKREKAHELALRILASCQKVGVKLSEQGIQKKVMGLPFFLIQKGLKVNNQSTVEECELMKKRYR
jgi:hypothetical protein